MNKQEFLEALSLKLSGVPEDIKAESLEYYNEIIDDKIEEGTPEETAVAEFGSIENIADGILSEIPLGLLVKEKVKKRKPLGALGITLLALGSPIWLSVLISAFAILFSIFISLWSVIASLWAFVLAVGVSGLGGIAATVIFTVKGDYIPALAILGMGIACIGISIFMGIASKYATRGMAWLTKKMCLLIKKMFIRKDKAL